MKKVVSYLSLMRSLIICLRILPFRQAIKIPILFRWNVSSLGLKKGRVLIESDVFHRMIDIGLREGSFGYGNGGGKNYN